MNREFKFRVWDNGKYHGPFVLGPTKISELCSTKDEEYTPNMVFQQFTGLLDKNGKEIYEGDIIEVQYQEKSFDTDIIKSVIQLFEVGWNEFNTSFSFYQNELCISKSIRSRNREFYEVVGNIFENPELVK